MSFSLSVILPNLNDARYLPQALDSLLGQSPPPDELVVVDDGSSDGSREIIAQYARRHKLIRPVYRERTQGVVATMNQFAREAASTHIFFAAADDLVLPGLFALSRGLLEKYPRTGLCSSLCRVLDEDGTDSGVFASPVPETHDGFIDPDAARRVMLHHDSWIIGGSVVYRREAILAEGGFRPELHGFADGMMHRLLALKQGACFIPRPLMSWRRRAGSVSDTTNMNAGILQEVLDGACTLMEGDPERRFSRTYIRRWRQRTAFGALRRQLARSRLDVKSAGVFGLHPADLRLARGLARMSAPPLADLYLFLRMRWFDVWSTPHRLLRHHSLNAAYRVNDEQACHEPT